MRWHARVITCSDAVASGTREDRSGPALAALLEQRGYDVAGISAVPDEADAIARAITDATDREHVELVVTTGGTGIAPRDVTPEAAASVADKKIDGFGELMRSKGMSSTPRAALSRSQAVVRGSSLIVNLPGSPAGAVESLTAVLQLIPHALELLSGKTEHNEAQDTK